MIRGSGISAAASSSSFFWPYDRPRAGASAYRARPTSSSSDIARSRSAAEMLGRNRSARPRVRAWTTTFSSTVRSLSSRVIWNVRPRPSRVIWCGRRPPRGSPSSLMSPPPGTTSPEIKLNSVVLPAPLGPIRPVSLPAATENEQRSTAVTPPKRRVTSHSSSRLIARRASRPFRLGPQQILDAGELALGPQELELAVLPLQHQEWPAHRQPALVPVEVTDDRAHRIGLGARGQPVAQLLVIGSAGGPHRLLHALAHREWNGLVLVGLALEFGLEFLLELLVGVLLAGDQALIRSSAVPRRVGDDAIGRVAERLLELGLRALRHVQRARIEPHGAEGAHQLDRLVG